MACLNNIVAIQTDAAPERVHTRFNTEEFAGFLARNLGTMNVICERARMFDRFIYDRSKAVFEYFGLPYEAERPE